MKPYPSLFLVVLCTALLCLTPARVARAATAAPPTQLTYQGFLTDNNGVPLGNTAPVNKTIIFRIYDAATGGNLKWSAQQVVTLDKGHFSVLLGEGSQFGQEPFSADLSSIFSGSSDASDRYLQLTVDNLNISPRLRFLPAPYAVHAKTATQLVDPVTGTSSLAINNGILSGNGASLTSLNASQITSGTLDNARTTATSGNTPSAIVARDGTGAVTLGNVTSTGFLNARGNTTTHVQGSFLEWNRPGDGSTWLLNQKGGGSGGIMFGEVSTANDVTERMRIDGAGNVGIGTTSPTVTLEVYGGIRARGGAPAAGGAFNYGYTFNGNGGDQDSGMFSSADGQLEFYGNSSEKMRIQSNGYVGIGTTSPTVTLEVTGGIRARGGAPAAGGAFNTGYSFNGNNGDNDSGMFSTADGQVEFYSNASQTMVLKQGNVGIKTATPTYPLTVAGYVNGTVNDDNNIVNGGKQGIDIFDNRGGQGGNQPATVTGNITVWAEKYFAGQGVIAFSDRRIKDITGRSDTAEDLKLIRQLAVTDYRMVDQSDHDSRVHKGFIAQEVQQHIPEAVVQSRNVVPTIYSRPAATRFDAPSHTLSVTMTNAHALKAGEIVRLVTDKEQLDLKVQSVPSPTEFVVGLTNAPGRLFVYGKQVDDFLSVDYNRVFSTGIGAIQELSKVTQQQAEALRKSESRIAELEQKVSKLAGLEGELAEMKKLLARLVQRPTTVANNSGIEAPTAR